MRKRQFLTEALTSTYDREGTEHQFPGLWLWGHGNSGRITGNGTGASGNGFGDPDMNVRALPPHLLERE